MASWHVTAGRVTLITKTTCDAHDARPPVICRVTRMTCHQRSSQPIDF